jgi:uncharacterized protein YidB (DUF937 family)
VLVLSTKEIVMSLLDAVLGAVGGSQGGVQGQLLNAVVGMLTQGGGGAAGAGGGAMGGMGGMGGLGGLLGKLTQSGLGDQVNSWVGTGQNMPVSADQITNAMGSDTIGQLAQQLGLGHGDVAGHLSQMLPHLVDKMTPGGQMPQAGAGGLGDLAGMLGGLLKR